MSMTNFMIRLDRLCNVAQRVPRQLQNPDIALRAAANLVNVALLVYGQKSTHLQAAERKLSEVKKWAQATAFRQAAEQVVKRLETMP